MNSLLRTVNSMSNRRHMLVRESLQQQLNTVVIEIQGAQGVLDNTPVEVCDEALALCSALEAIFLHGLKDSLLNRVTEALSGPDYDAMPQPSFWGPLLVFSHRGIIDQIQSLKQITTEVGYCRAWIRLALNEGLLSSYFGAIRRENSALKPYYNKAAFIRDVDLVEVAQRLLESVDGINFSLACNSSLLNFWSSTPLLMAAIWSPPMKSAPVFSAVDIAKTINSNDLESSNFEEIETASSIGSLSSYNSSQNNLSGLSEDEALRIILSKKTHRVEVGTQSGLTSLASPTLRRKMRQNGQDLSAKAPMDSPGDGASSARKELEPALAQASCEVAKSSPQVEEERSTLMDEGLSKFDASVGNSLIGKLGWSTSYEDCESSMTTSMVSRTSEGPTTPGEGPTYDALLKSYRPTEYKSPNLEELLEKYPVYESTAATSVDAIEPRETRNFDEQLARLAREKGLDLQNYNCLDCGQHVGLDFAKANVCNFSGDYFCSNCMATEAYMIPAKVLHNWDLKKYPVCAKAATYLNDCSTLLDLKIVNPRIYSAVDTMAQLQTLRVQLNLLRAYLFTCREPIIESFQKKLSTKDYLYEHIHQYSVSDLPDIPNGTLAQQLQKVVEFARNHVVNCWLCSQKGFICEVCNNAKIIYPFDTQSTYRCGSCSAVFHSDCMHAAKSCPKCERRRKRVDLPLLDMGSSEPLNETASLASAAFT